MKIQQQLKNLVLKCITEKNLKVFKKRFMSFWWRGWLVAGVIAIEFLADSLGLFNLSPTVVTFIGLILGEITKQLNKSKYENK